MGASLTTEYLELQPTGHICGDCGKELKYTEECWLLQIAQPQRIDSKTVYHVVIDELDASGDFLFDPYFFCFNCFENLYEGHKSEIEDEPPVKDEESPFECVCCGSGIREWEYAGTFSVGEFHPSKRAPNGVRGPHFTPTCEPELICLYCLVLINEGFIAMWDELTQFGECDDCIQLRCWRYGTNACSCGCHIDDPELQDDGGLQNG